MGGALLNGDPRKEYSIVMNFLGEISVIVYKNSVQTGFSSSSWKFGILETTFSWPTKYPMKKAEDAKTNVNSVFKKLFIFTYAVIINKTVKKVNIQCLKKKEKSHFF